MTVVKARDIKQDSGSIVFNFKDVAVEAQSMLDAARAEAKRIVDKARDETQHRREEVFAAAEKEGYAQGSKKGYEDAFEPAKKDGYEKGYAQALEDIKSKFEEHIDEPLKDLSDILNYFEENKTRLIWEAEQSFALLSIKLAEKVIHRNIELHPEMIKDSVAAALDTVSQTSNIAIRVSPDDISVIEELKGELDYILGRFKSVKFQPDINISRGGCLVLTERGKVDARIEVQLERIARDILETEDKLDIGLEDEQLRFVRAAKDAGVYLDEVAETKSEPVSETAVEQEVSEEAAAPLQVEDTVETSMPEIKEESAEDVIADDSIADEISEVAPIEQPAENVDAAVENKENETQPEPKRDQATELRKQMENNNETDNQENN